MASAYRRPACLVLLGIFVLALGVVPARAATETDTLQRVSFKDHGTFERAVITLGHGRVPGEFAPAVSSSYRNGSLVARVQLPPVTRTLKVDGAGLGRAISKYYVVRSSGRTRNLFVDFHLKGAAGAVNVYKLDDPARIVVDVTPGGKKRFPGPVTGVRAVVTEPHTRSLVGPRTFVVTGYGRPPEARGAWRIKNNSGLVIKQGNYRTSDWTTTWGSFRFSASYPARLSGTRCTLQVGEFSARDGRFRGVSVPLRFR